MSTFRVCSRALRSVWTFHWLIEMILLDHYCKVVNSCFVFTFRHHYTLPSTQQECTHTLWNVFVSSLKRMRVLIWIYCSNRITVDPALLCWFTVNVTLMLSIFHTDLSFFEKSFEMFSREQKEAQTIQQSTQLGLLLVDKKGFKEKFASSLRSCLEVTCIVFRHFTGWHVCVFREKCF